MKLFTFYILSVLLPFSLAADDNANTKPCDTACGAYGGKCSAAVSIALGGNLTAANDALFYGKYCGRNNKCSSGPCPPACDDIDKACKRHDSCLDRLVKIYGSPSAIPLDKRCVCNSQLVLRLANEFEQLGNYPTYLCDKNFYIIQLSPTAKLIDVLGNEARLIAAPFCCELKSYGNLCTQYESIKPFCDDILSDLQLALKGAAFC